MSPAGDHRDDEIGVALRSLPVPPHEPTFFERLDRRLADEATRPLARPRWTNPRALAAVAAAVAAVVLVASLANRDASGPVSPRLVTVSSVRARVDNALGSLSTVQGRLTVECAVPVGSCSPPPDGRATRSWQFVATATGDERVTGIGFTDDSSYSAATRTRRSLVDTGSRVEAAEVRNAGAGPPDAFSRSPLRRNYASAVRAFLDGDEKAEVREVAHEGRRAWQVTVAVVPNKLAGPDASGDRLDVVVDRQTGFPLQITERLGNRFVQQVRISDLVLDRPVPGEIDLDLPGRAFREDAGFRETAGEGVASVTGFPGVLPTEMPDGFARGPLTVTAGGGATGNEGMNPPETGVLSVAYRHGFDQITVSVRGRGGHPACASDGTGSGPCWADPMASGEGVLDSPVAFDVADGALAGGQAQLVTSARGTPHVWVLTPDLVVTVAGDASASELRAIANSFAEA